MTALDEIAEQGYQAGQEIAELLKDQVKLYPETEYTGDHGHRVMKRLWPDGEATPLPLEPSRKLRDHSPTGFSWGYCGSGPAQLALALLLDATSIPETAERWYQTFKAEIVAGWASSEGWVLFRSDILNWLQVNEGMELKVGEN